MNVRTLWNLIGIGLATQADDTGDVQRLQVTEKAAGKGFADRITDKVRRLTEFGFTSVPPLQAEVLVLRRDGDRSQSMVIATSHRPSRMKNLQPGDVAVYDVRGAYVKFTSAGIVIDGAGLPMTIQNVGTVTINGDLHVTGEVVGHSNGTQVALTTHLHSGVQTGGGKTGQPTT